jgi:hypothetical protein
MVFKYICISSGPVCIGGEPGAVGERASSRAADSSWAWGGDIEYCKFVSILFGNEYALENDNVCRALCSFCCEAGVGGGVEVSPLLEHILGILESHCAFGSSTNRLSRAPKLYVFRQHAELESIAKEKRSRRDISSIAASLTSRAPEQMVIIFNQSMVSYSCPRHRLLTR